MDSLCLHVLVHGSLQTYIGNDAIATKHSVDVVGEAALLSTKPWTESALVTTAYADVWMIPRQVFANALDDREHPIVEFIRERYQLSGAGNSLLFTDFAKVKFIGRGGFGLVLLVKHNT